MSDLLDYESLEALLLNSDGPEFEVIAELPSEEAAVEELVNFLVREQKSSSHDTILQLVRRVRGW